MRARRWIYATLAAYALGFALFAPRVLTVVDEERYVSQAVAFAQGRTTIEGWEIVAPPVPTRVSSNYPPGTSLLQTPLVWAAGWRGALVLSLVSLVAATVLTASWLSGAGKSPAFALLIPAFPGALLFGRIGMSDMPAGALVALVCWLLWRPDARGTALSFAAGLCSGLVLLLREPVAVLIAPLVLGALLRRRVATAAFIGGGIAGVAARLLLSYWLFGDPLYVRDSGLGFAPASLRHTIPVYALILLVLFPGGALLPFFYRGDRRPELVTAFVAFVALFLLYDYDVIRMQGVMKGVLTATRFMIPALPLMVWMAADVWPRALAGLSGRVRGIVGRGRPLVGAGIVAAAFLVHPVTRGEEGDDVAIVRAMFEYTRGDRVVITNGDATLKYLSGVYGPRRLALRKALEPDSVRSLVRREQPAVLALLNRSDSEVFRADAAENDRFLAAVAAACEVVQKYERDFGWASLRIVELWRCR